jgi:uncharacterized membrane protein YedE/YeeE
MNKHGLIKNCECCQHMYCIPSCVKSRMAIVFLFGIIAGVLMSGCAKPWVLIHGMMCRDISGGKQCETDEVR